MPALARQGTVPRVSAWNGASATLMKKVVHACEDDLHRYCAGAAPGTAKECLRTNFRSLSIHCKRELFEAKKEM